MEEVDFFLLPRRQLLEGTPVNTFGVVFSLCWMAGVLALCIIYIVSLHPHATRRWLLSCCCHKHQTGRPNNNLPHGPKRLHTAPALLKHAHQDGTYLELPVTHHGLVEVPLDTPHASPVRPANESEEPVQVKEEYTYLGRHSTQQGYQDHLPGTLLLSLLAVTSLLPIAGLFFITLSSYYFYIPGADFVQLSYFFILAWHVMTAWLLALWAIKDRLRNLFRLPVPLDVATYVELTRRDKLNLAGRLPSRNRCAAAMRWLLSIAHMGEEDSSLSRETVKVKVDTVHAGERFFNFRLQRYSYNRAMGCFTAVVPDLGRLRSDFHRLADRGLSDAKRSERLSLLGVNRLSIPQPSLTDSLLEEFASFFYLCTFSLLWLLFLVHYWKVGIVIVVLLILSGFSESVGIVIVVLLILSGSVRVYQARKSLLEMEELAKVVGHSDVFTGWDDSGRRQWASIDNTSLVAGDVIRLQRGPVSADLVLVSGSARVDEASLTGESLPALKLSVPNTDEPYQAKTGDIKSTIFAGTLVTNSSGPAGPGDDGEQVWGVGDIGDVGNVGDVVDNGEQVWGVGDTGDVGNVGDIGDDGEQVWGVSDVGDVGEVCDVGDDAEQVWGVGDVGDVGEVCDVGDDGEQVWGVGDVGDVGDDGEQVWGDDDEQVWDVGDIGDVGEVGDAGDDDEQVWGVGDVGDVGKVCDVGDDGEQVWGVVDIGDVGNVGNLGDDDEQVWGVGDVGDVGNVGDVGDDDEQVWGEGDVGDVGEVCNLGDLGDDDEQVWDVGHVGHVGDVGDVGDDDEQVWGVGDVGDVGEVCDVGDDDEQVWGVGDIGDVGNVGDVVDNGEQVWGVGDTGDVGNVGDIGDDGEQVWGVGDVGDVGEVCDVGDDAEQVWGVGDIGDVGNVGNVGDVGDDDAQAEAAALAVVVSTGGATDRGKFLQQLLFSPPLRTCLDEEVEAVVVILALVAFGTIVFIMCLAESLSIFTWIQAVIILLGIMPPMLPVLVTLTMTYNQASLKRQRVLTATGDSKRLLLA
eukprot:g82994.t1